MFLNDRSIVEQIGARVRNSPVETHMPLIHQCQDGGGGHELVRAAHREARISATTNPAARDGVERDNAQPSTVLCFQRRKGAECLRDERVGSGRSGLRSQGSRTTEHGADPHGDQGTAGKHKAHTKSWRVLFEGRASRLFRRNARLPA